MHGEQTLCHFHLSRKENFHIIFWKSLRLLCASYMCTNVCFRTARLQGKLGDSFLSCLVKKFGTRPGLIQWYVTLVAYIVGCRGVTQLGCLVLVLWQYVPLRYKTSTSVINPTVKYETWCYSCISFAQTRKL